MKKTWRDVALKEPVDRAVVSSDILRFLRATASECFGARSLEQGGFLGGLVKDRVFYAVDSNYLAMEYGARVTLPEKLHFTDWLSGSRYCARFPHFRTLLYHAHPELNEDIVRELWPKEADKILNFFRGEIKAGIHDYLGSELSLPRVLNEELGRRLSADDIGVTPENYHLLLSHTLSETDRLSHLNLWHIGKGRACDRMLPVGVMSAEDFEKISTELRGMRDIRRKVHFKLFGFYPGEDLDKIACDEPERFESIIDRTERLRAEKEDFYNRQRCQRNRFSLASERAVA